MVKDLIGLDIGAGSIKLVKIKKNKNKIELEKARSIELKDADSIKDAVTQLLKSEGINSARAAVSLSGQSVFTRFVKLPKISEKKVEQVVKYEAQQQIPFPIEKVVWDYQLFEHKESSEIEVCLAAVKKEIVDKIISELTQLKLDIISIQPSPIALYNILKFNGEIEDDTLVLDIGEKVTDIFITKGRRIWIRSIPIAGKDITKAISGEMNLKLEEAEQLKKKEGITLVNKTGDEDLTPRSDAISKAINPVLTDLIKEISRSISYYKSQFDREATLQKILLSGGTSNLKYIERFFKKNLKINVEKINLFKKISPTKYVRANLDETEGQWAVALGLGLKAVAEPEIHINLLSKEQKILKQFDYKKKYIYASEFLIILLFLLLGLFSIKTIGVNNQNLNIIREQMEKFKEKEATIDEIQTGIKKIEKKLDFLSQINKSRRFWLDILAQINKTIEKDTWLTNFTPDPESKKVVVIEGKTTASFDAVKNLREKLEESEYFSKVETLKADPAPEKEADYNIIFTMKLELKDKAPLRLMAKKESKK
jgi:type IV pilus assembly protein PilM